MLDGEIYKEAAYWSEEILKAALYKTAAVQLHNSDLKKSPSKMNKTC